MPLALLFFGGIFSSIPGLLLFHTNFRIICSSSVKIIVGNFTRNCIKSVDYFGYYLHFNNVNSSIQEHEIPFHFFESSSVSFINVL